MAPGESLERVGLRRVARFGLEGLLRDSTVEAGREFRKLVRKTITMAITPQARLLRREGRLSSGNMKYQEAEWGQQ